MDHTKEVSVVSRCVFRGEGVTLFFGVWVFVAQMV